MDTSAIDNLLGQLRAAASTNAAQSGKSVAPASQGADFAAILKSSIDNVNVDQTEATKMAQDFQLGTNKANLTDVMVSMQKANISFQQMVQVRNRLVSAYHDIMNMQV